MHVRGGVSDYHVGPAQPPAAVAVSDTREKKARAWGSASPVNRYRYLHNPYYLF
jgi:hypothetical protein